tara:strand:+ start:54 stop:263 length:210 start_codon:yes stop_codon:yes gene_type:complete
LEFYGISILFGLNHLILNIVYDKVYVQLIIDSPELATQIGIPVLQNGSVPLDTLEEIVNDYISEKGVKE